MRGHFQLGVLLAALSPGYALVQVMLPAGGQILLDFPVDGSPDGWLFLALASWRLPHCWKEKVGPTRLRWRDRFRQWTYGPPAFREELRRRLVGINPFLWLVSRNRLTPLILPVILLLAGGLWIWAWCEAGRQGRFGVLIFVVCTNHLWLLAGMAAEASGHLVEQRRSGALEFVLCCHSLAGGGYSGRPMAVVAAAVPSPIDRCLDGRCGGGTSQPNRAGGRRFRGARSIYLVPGRRHADAGGGCLCRRLGGNVAGHGATIEPEDRLAGSATAETVGLLVFMPLMGLWMIAIILLIFERDFLERFFSDFGPVFGVWFLLSLSAAFGFPSWARKRLLTQFREMAAVQGGEPLGLFGQLGRWLGRAFRRR